MVATARSYWGRGGSGAEIVGDPALTVAVVNSSGGWHGFVGVSDPPSTLANRATERSDLSELDRRDVTDRGSRAWAVA